MHVLPILPENIFHQLLQSLQQQMPQEHFLDLLRKIGVIQE